MNSLSTTLRGTGQVPARLLTIMMMILAAVSSLVITQPANAATIFNEYPIPTTDSRPTVTATGPDGTVWFAESNANKLGRIAPNGTITEIALPAGPSLVQGLAAGPDGAMWYTDDWGYIGRVATDGSVTRYATNPERGPTGITAGPDGNMWFTMWSGYIGKITPSGVITEYSVRQGSNSTQPRNITAGSDGALWVTHLTDPARISRVATDGTITPYLITNTDIDTPYDIVSGPDGALWWTNTGDNTIGRMTTAGVMTAHEVSAPEFSPDPTLGITVGADGALWFVDPINNRIVRMTTAGAVSAYTIPTSSSGARDITLGADGALWFSETTANKIGRLLVDNTRPTVTFTSPTSFAGPFPTGPTVTITASDTSGLSSMAIHLYKADNTLLSTCGSATPAQLAAGTMSCDLSGVAPGSYYIKAGAFDTAGNNRTINSGTFVVGS